MMKRIFLVVTIAFCCGCQQSAQVLEGSAFDGLEWFFQNVNRGSSYEKLLTWESQTDLVKINADQMSSDYESFLIFDLPKNNLKDRFVIDTIERAQETVIEYKSNKGNHSMTITYSDLEQKDFVKLESEKIIKTFLATVRRTFVLNADGSYAYESIRKRFNKITENSIRTNRIP